MSKSRRQNKNKMIKSPKTKPSEWICLEKFSVKEKKTWESIKDKFLEFHWGFYFTLAYQRKKNSVAIKKSLLDAAINNFSITKWQRVVKYKYSLEPLSCKGSLSDPGGRFNIGEIDDFSFGPFPSLYIASTKNTAKQEMLCQKIDTKNYSAALDFALTTPSSMTNVSVSGKLNSVINLNQPHKLQPFLDIIGKFKVPTHLKKLGEKLGQNELILVNDTKSLNGALLAPNWREWPMQFDVPSSSQIFGQLVVDAGIEGILYPSKYDGKDCLAVFPQNFESGSDSFIQLDDPAPQEVALTRLDAKTWKKYFCGQKV